MNSQKWPQQYIWSHKLFKTLATPPQKIDSISPSLEIGWGSVVASKNRMQQKWHCVTFFFFQGKLKVSPLSPALQEEFLRVERSGKLADQYNRIENSDIHTHKYVQLISYKDAKAVQ